MEQEPGKAGEPVPAAPSPEAVPAFEPKIGSESPLENGTAQPEPAPEPGEHPAVDEATGTASAAISDDAFAPVTLQPVPDTFLEATPPAAPAPVMDTEGWDLPTTPERPAAESFEPLETDPLPEYAPTATESAAVPADEVSLFPAQPPPPPAVISAWGPPPPAWPLAASGEMGSPDSGGMLATAETSGAEIQPVVEEPYVETGPNWMLAFVCLWAAGTALNETWYLAQQVGLTPALIRNVTVMGYGVLGLGLIGFALDALQSGKKQAPAAALLKALVPALLTLAGVILLVLSNDPGRRI